MKPRYIPFLIITALSFLMLLIDCGSDSSTKSYNDPADTLIPIQWVGTNVVYDSTIAKKNYSIIYFYTTWCGYCKKMDSLTFKNPKVSKIIYESFNMVKINVDSDTLVDYFDTTMTCHDLAKNIYKISGYPTSCIFGKKGNYIGPVVGYYSASNFATLLEAIRIGTYGE